MKGADLVVRCAESEGVRSVFRAGAAGEELSGIIGSSRRDNPKLTERWPI